MTVQIVRFTTTEEEVTAVDAAIRELVAALDAKAPAGVGYAGLRLADGVSHVLVLTLADGVENPLPALPEGQALLQRLEAWAGGQRPMPEPVTVIAAHRLLEGVTA